MIARVEVEMSDGLHRTMDELEAGLNELLRSPKDEGRLELIVRRPRVGEREVLQQGQLDLVEGLVGDSWRLRGNPHTKDGAAHPDMQLNIMGARTIALLARERERWQLAGDQLFLDLDLSEDNLPPGTRLILGAAMIEITDQPHTGCRKFSERFGSEAMKFVNSSIGRRLRLRGLNARVTEPGVIRVGDVVRKA